MKNSPATSSTITPGEVFSPVELRALAETIKESGELGRSRIYANLLDFLVECCIQGRQPKEIEIAMEVLGRASDFDVSRDSTVRVYIHQLRKKLDGFYLRHNQTDPCRIVIPKGQYTIAAMTQDIPAAPVSPRAWRNFGVNTYLLLLVVILLGANLLQLQMQMQEAQQATASRPPSNHAIWHSLLDDDLPILLVMGDYYIFGELNENGDVARMIREFDVNSSGDLEDRIFSDIENTQSYLDLDLSYMPEGSAYALIKILPMLQGSGKRIDITMMSDLTTQDIRNNHIVYVGYISALDKLSDMTFAASGLRIGRSYDELQNLDTGNFYTSDAGLPEAGQQFRDYGLFSTIPASSETQLVVVAGMRDAGLMHTAMAVSDEVMLTELDSNMDPLPSTQPVSFEALFEVFGIDRMNFSANLVYSRLTNPSIIWGTSVSSLSN